MTAQAWIDRLRLEPHPEGGYFRETYRCAEGLHASHLPDRFAGNRSFSTAIVYLLEQGQFSAFHRIRSDEVWHFYDGDPLEIFVLQRGGGLHRIRLGRGVDETVQAVVPAGEWFAARCCAESRYSLCGCTVAPGFDFADFEMADRMRLLEEFSDHGSWIEAFTRL